MLHREAAPAEGGRLDAFVIFGYAI